MRRFEIVLSWPKREKLWAQCPALSINLFTFSGLYPFRNFPCLFGFGSGAGGGVRNTTRTITTRMTTGTMVQMISTFVLCSMVVSGTAPCDARNLTSE